MLQLWRFIVWVYAREASSGLSQLRLRRCPTMQGELSPHVSRTRHGLPCQPSKIITKYRRIQ
jgi:hypothetical protein